MKSIKTKQNHVKRFQTRALTTVICILLIVAVAAAMEVPGPNGDLSSYIQSQIDQALSNQGQGLIEQALNTEGHITAGSGLGDISLSQSITQTIGSGADTVYDKPDSNNEAECQLDVTCACAKPCGKACDLFKAYYNQVIQIRLEGCDEMISGRLIEVHCQRFLMLDIIDIDEKYNSPPVKLSYMRAVNIDKVVWIDFSL
jgi:hypothetical protein